MKELENDTGYMETIKRLKKENTGLKRQIADVRYVDKAEATVTNKIGNDIGEFCVKYMNKHSTYSDGRKALLQDCEWYPLIADICNYISHLAIPITKERIIEVLGKNIIFKREVNKDGSAIPVNPEEIASEILEDNK